MHRLATSTLLGFVCLADLSAGELDGRYLTTLDGAPAQMILHSEGRRVEGEYLENSHLRLAISGSFDGQLLQAQISDPRSGRLIANMNANYANAMLNAHIAARSPSSGAVLERTALFQRQTDAPTSATPSMPRDPALIGTWVHQQPIDNGGASFAAMTSVDTLQLSANGHITHRRGAIAGSADWNPDTPGELQYRGHWYSTDGLLLVQPDGQPSYQPAARYRISAQQLVTESNTGEMIWTRR